MQLSNQRLGRSPPTPAPKTTAMSALIEFMRKTSTALGGEMSFPPSAGRSVARAHDRLTGERLPDIVESCAGAAILVPGVRRAVIYEAFAFVQASVQATG